ncbi:hypothetical protein PENANT_c217G01220 [Penicillium antarcticum]|uniref:Uncharacterized protein n=1 Tax=Penicillium antarcticum TaxID=416450 RepID=A0A1V6P986_9EURO|nr:hypothetical protein PENANT_c217G01220 [Penicillium antarcticum]
MAPHLRNENGQVSLTDWSSFVHYPLREAFYITKSNHKIASIEGRITLKSITTAASKNMELHNAPNLTILNSCILLPPEDRRSFSRVCSRVNAVLVPLIYRTVTFRAASEWALNVLDIDAFFSNQSHLQPFSYLQHTRHLSIQAQIHIARFNRCAHYSIFRTSGLTQNPSTLGTSDEAKAHRQFLGDISDQVQMVFACLKENSLLSFQWGLGTCLSPGILDKNGYLCRHQRSLNRLSLITDGSCPEAGGALNGLSEFSSLKTIEWEGIQQPAEIDS